MKKTIAILLALCLCIGLCACGKVNNSNVYHVPLVTTVPVETPPATDANEFGRLAFQEKYVSVLNWIATNGTAVLEEKDVNNYGRINGYEYDGYSFDVDAHGQINSSAKLYFNREELVDSEYDDGILIDRSIRHTVSIDMQKLEVTYSWEYETWIVTSAFNRTNTLASGKIRIPLADITRTGNNHSISNYSEESTFRDFSGYKDVRAVINADFEEIISNVINFLTQTSGVAPKDMGFVNYT